STVANVQGTSRAWLEVGTVGGLTRIALFGEWSIATAALLERDVMEVPGRASGRVRLDLSQVAYIDTAGAWLIRRLEEELGDAGIPVERTGESVNAARLLGAVRGDAPPVEERPASGRALPIRLAEMLGRTTVNAGADLIQALGILGGVMRGLGRACLQPS